MMNLEEKVIGGILHWRATTDGEWMAYTAKELTEKIADLNTTNSNLVMCLKRREDLLFAIKEMIRHR